MDTIELCKGTVQVEYTVSSRERKAFTIKVESGENTLYNDVLGTVLEKLRSLAPQLSDRALSYVVKNQWAAKIVSEMLSGSRRKEKSDFDFEERELFHIMGLPLPFSILTLVTKDGVFHYLPYRPSTDRVARKLFYRLKNALLHSAAELKAADVEHLNLDGMTARFMAYFSQGVLDLLPAEWKLLRQMDFRLNKLQLFIKNKSFVVRRSAKNNISNLVHNRILEMVMSGLERVEEQISEDELTYLSSAHAINRIAKKVQEDWSGEYVHFENVEATLLKKLRINTMSEHRTVVSREGVPYVLQYRCLEGRMQEKANLLIDNMIKFPLRESQMKYLVGIGVNKLVRIIDADSTYSKVVEDHELRRIFSHMGIKLSSEQFMVKSAARDMVTFTVPNNPGEQERTFYTRLIKNSSGCDAKELERLRDYGIQQLFDPNMSMPEDVQVILRKLRIERPAYDRDLARV